MMMIMLLVIYILLQGVDINYKHGQPLREAITNNHQLLVCHHHHNHHHHKENHQQPQHDDDQMCALLDRPDLRPELRDENGRTALHVAAWFNKVVMVVVKMVVMIMMLMVEMLVMIMMVVVMVNIVSMTLRKEQLLAFSPLDLAFLPMIKTTK